MLGCTVAKYAERCKTIDDRKFAVSVKRSRVHCQLLQNDLYKDFWNKVRQTVSNMNIASLHLVEIERVCLTGIGRANQAVLKHSNLIKMEDDNILVMRIEQILGLADDDGNIQWLGFFGPMWSCTRSARAFEVFEFNARLHYKGRVWWGVDEDILPCWVQHIHRLF